MRIQLQLATDRDVARIVSLRMATSQHLTEKFGVGHWSGRVTERGVRWEMRRGSMYVARVNRKLAATLVLSTIKPWAIDRKYFSPSERPLYLTGMAVDPAMQGTGIGRRCLEQAWRIAKKWPADAVRLDAYDAEAGAGEFYRKCGMREVGRAVYKNNPLIYFEMRL